MTLPTPTGGSDADGLPKWLTETATAPELRLLASLRLAPRTAVPDELLLTAIETLTIIDSKINEINAPCTGEEIANALKLMADTIQCELPEPQGIMVYAQLLYHLPSNVLKQACIYCLRTHKWRTLPLPAELLEAKPTVDYTSELKRIKDNIRTWKFMLNQRHQHLLARQEKEMKDGKA